MYFLIDNENVKNTGYRGVNFLLPEDTIEIFYSDSCKNITQGLFQYMEQSGCEIRICKLQQSRKNALDFYIVSRLGELIGNGYQGNAAIISGDQGFKSVQEYWKKCATIRKQIVLAPTIADAIVYANESNNRTKMLREQLKNVSLENEFARYDEKNKMHKLLRERFENTQFIERLDEIQEVLEEKSSKKIVYLDSLKRFGKKDGIYVFNQIKELVG